MRMLLKETIMHFAYRMVLLCLIIEKDDMKDYLSVSSYLLIELCRYGSRNKGSVDIPQVTTAVMMRYYC